jgi:hypothetical protein
MSGECRKVARVFGIAVRTVAQIVQRFCACAKTEISRRIGCDGNAEEKIEERGATR